MRSSSNTRRWPEAEGLEARATTVAAAVAGAALVGGVVSADAQRKAGNRAADAQQNAANQGIEQQNMRFAAMQKLLEPYAAAGTKSLAGQQDLLGLNGNDAQAAAIQALQGSPQFKALLEQGENSILANASATGGLRGGNTQAALAQYSPQLLAATINDQYAKLGGITSIGQNAAAMTGNAGMQTGNNITSLLGQVGSAQAGAALSQGRATAGYANALTSAVGSYFGGGFGGLGGAGGGGLSAYDPSGYGITPANVYTPVRGGF